MKNFQFRFIISAFCLASILMAANSILAAPVRLNQVVQVINAKPGKANTGNFASLRLVNDYSSIVGDEDDTTKPTTAPQDDDRVITTTTTEIVEDEVCDCEQTTVVKKGFPYWVLGFAALPLLFLIPGRDRTRTPTPTTPTTQTPTPMTPTPTPGTPTPTPPMSPTPTPPEPVPEPMTLLLFGTGLAGIGVAARKKFGKKEKTNTEN